MDRILEASNLVKELNSFKRGELKDYEFIKIVCSYFDRIKDFKELTPSDLKFLKYIVNVIGIPHYYDLLFSKFGHKEEFFNYNLNTFASLMYESSLHTDENIKIHKYQKEVLSLFKIDSLNRFFLSASTSFGKTYLIYEIIKKMNYRNIVLIFPTIALLSENYEKLMTDINYTNFRNEYKIHTLSDVEELGDKNIFIYTPERYLSFMDKNIDIEIDFTFVDEIYKIDNEYLIDEENKENERDIAYRVALFNILRLNYDVLLVGPYIKIPNKDLYTENQSFNNFLAVNQFEVIDFNNIEIVNKKFKDVYQNKEHYVDENLIINLKGYSSKKVATRLSKIVDDILALNENIIIYTKGPSTAENKAKDIIEFSKNLYNIQKTEYLKELIAHLKETFKLEDWSLINSLEHKIGIHHGLIPKYIQKEIISLFNGGHLDLLISTTTITEGVNTSAKNLIVTSASKGNKPLKTFDAKNIAGRAGRFLHHYSGRVLVYNKSFSEIINGKEDEIKHKNYDEVSAKNEIDYFITENEFLSDFDLQEKKKIEYEIEKRKIPYEIIKAYKVISYSDKIKIYDELIKLKENRNKEYKYMRSKIGNMAHNLTFLDYDCLYLIIEIFKPIISNDKLKFLIEYKSEVKKGKNKGKEYPILIYMLSAYINDGYIGSINYNKKERGLSTDKAVQESSRFIYNTLKYQLVKYLGIFNLLYRFLESIDLNINMNEVIGLDKLLRKLEYNATTELGKLASDYGVPNKIIEYYDSEENIKKSIKNNFDSFELRKFEQIESILS